MQPVNGGRYIPFDEENLQFSSQPGLRQQDQAGQIANLNQIVLKGQQLDPNSEMAQMINGLAADPYYVPQSFLGTANDVSAYDVYTQYCRSCHVSNGVVNATSFPVTTPQMLAAGFQASGVCHNNQNVMPNAKVTFDRLWTTELGPTSGNYIPDFIAAYVDDTQLAAYYAWFDHPMGIPPTMPTYQACQAPGYYNPYPP
jgi:hypothetical protein